MKINKYKKSMVKREDAGISGAFRKQNKREGEKQVGENSRFGFCPKCGALARDGVCQSCGYRNPVIQAQKMGVQQPAKKDGHKKTMILSVILSFIVIAVVVLILAGSYSIWKSAEGRERGMSGFSSNQNRMRDSDIPDQYESGYAEEYSVPKESEAPVPEGSYSHYSGDVTQRNWEEEGQDEAYSYYTGPYNALRDDVGYELSFTEEIYSSDDGSVFICVEYPQIEAGEIANTDYINAALYYEYEYFFNLYEEDYKPLATGKEDTCYCISDAFVTYMDEKILSVVFKEEIYIELQAAPFTTVNFFCLNFDLETGTLLDNSELLRIDEAFAIDFRVREAEENGDEALTYYTDQEIQEMLLDDSRLVIFYTPMGMEVGLVLDDRIVYVTYKDYEKYINSF